MQLVKLVDSKILEMAKSQHGVIARWQLRDLGLSSAQIRWRIKRGRWRRELPGILRMPWSEQTWRQKVWAAVLWAGSEALVSHQAAACLWGLDERQCERVDLSASHPLRSGVPWLSTHQRRLIPKTSRRTKHGIALTSPARTLMDLAATSAEEDLERLVENALRCRMVSVAELRRALAWAPARTPGAVRLNRLLRRGQWSAESQSELERRALELFRCSGLPAPHCQYTITDGNRHLATVDFAWPAAKLIVEAEGFQFHSGRRVWERDIARYNGLVLRGWRVLRLTWSDVGERADAFVETLARSLETYSSRQSACA